MSIAWRVVGVVAAVGVVSAGVVLYVAFGAFLPWREKAEAVRLADLAGIGPGATVAEIGAGQGRMAAELARRVGPHGRVFATEIAAARLDDLRAVAANLPQLSAVEASRTATGLPDACCDVVVMRAMYHHVETPREFIQGVARALRPGGRAIVIDFAPDALWFHRERPADTSARRTGHGVRQTDVAEEFADAGFVIESSRADWSGPLWLSIFVRR